MVPMTRRISYSQFYNIRKSSNNKKTTKIQHMADKLLVNLHAIK